MCNEDCSKHKDRDFIRCCACSVFLGCESLKCLAFGNNVECRKVEASANRAREMAKALGLKEISDDDMDELVKNMLKEEYNIGDDN